MRLYFRYFLIQLKSQMQYKLSFALTITGQFLTAFTTLLGIWFLLSRFHQVEGFTFSDILLCFAIVWMAYSLSETFARGFDHFAAMIGNGEFDRILVRPRGTILQVLGSKIEFTRLGRLCQSVLVFCYAIPASGIHWTADKILTLVLMVVSGFFVFSGLFVIYAALCFFTTEGLEFINIFTDGGREFGTYPLAIYGRGVLKFFTFVVPLALFQYYPLLYLLGRTENKAYRFLPLLALLFLLPCRLLWRIGVRHFRSTGS